LGKKVDDRSVIAMTVFAVFAIATIALALPVKEDPKAEYYLEIGGQKIGRNQSGVLKIPESKWQTITGEDGHESKVVSAHWDRHAPCVFKVFTPKGETWVDGRSRIDDDQLNLKEGKNKVVVYSVRGRSDVEYSTHDLNIVCE
jgi:hypothetical protein